MRSIITRRQYLALLSSSLAFISGCSNKSEGGQSGTSTSDGKQTKNASGLPSLNTEAVEGAANVARQPKSNHPAKVDLELTNVAESSLIVEPSSRGGHPFEFIEALQGPKGSATFFPVDTNGVNIIEGSLPAERKDGCWRFDRDEDAEIGVVSYAFERTLPPDETYSIRHRVYYDGPESVCFPEGTYDTSVGVEVGWKDGDESLEVTYDLSLEVDEQGNFTTRLE